jgi:hypothetical protein
MKKKLNINAIAIIMIGRTKILRHESEIVIPSTTWFLFNIQPAKVGLQIIIIYMFPIKQRGTAMGLSGLAVGLAPAMGPILRHESEIVIPSTTWFLFNIQPAKVGPIAGARPTAKPLRPIVLQWV